MSTIGELARRLESGALDGELRNIYRPADGDVKWAAGRYQALLDRFALLHGDAEGAELFSTPGRTEIGGNHTDHQHGCVLAGSVDLDVVAVAAPNGRDRIRIESEGFPGQDVPLDNLLPNPDEYNDSRALIRGIAAKFMERGHAVGGFDACLSSRVLKGSGLSSSAAYEVMVGTIVNHLFAAGVESPVEVAKIGRYAENVFFGKPSGLMDQLACAVGGVQFIDLRDTDNPVIRKVDFDLRAAGYALCIIDSGADHSCMTDEYSPIPLEMGRVAAHFGKKVLREVARDEFLRDIAAIRAESGDRAVLRALHFFDDNDRVPEEARALEEGRTDDFLTLVNASGRSSHMYLQNVFPSGTPTRQEVGVALALCGEYLRGRGAYRVHGGGFAGTVQAFVPLDMLDAFKAGVESGLGAGCCHILNIRSAGSVRLA